jgi:hypothetical protein
MKPVAALLLLGACSAASPGGKCEGTATKCESGTELTFCENGALRKITCKGPNGCTHATCDTSTHTVGDGCQGSLFSCDPSMGSQILQCVSGTLVAFRTCNGPRQCYFENNALGCDVTLGDTCPKTYEARYLCDSVDPQQVLRCTDGGVAFFSKCPGVKNCFSADAGLICQ